MLHVKETVIGIIGDGQLALMLAESLIKLNRSFLCLATQSNSPMMRAFPQHTTLNAEEFRNKADIFTLENEFLNELQLQKLLQDKVTKVFPDLDSYCHFEDKLSQRRFFQRLDLPSPRWRSLCPGDDSALILNEFVMPFVLKASQGGYDGKGVRVIKTAEEYQEALSDFGFYDGCSLLIEEKVSIKQEVAQGFVQSVGGCSWLPLVDTVQTDGVCNFVYYPPAISESVRLQIDQIIQKLIDYPLIGIFNFEFFIDDKDVVTINEGAPRPHNSQHLTLNASDFSQFDLLALHLTGQENLPASVTTKKSAMINILGKSSSSDYQLKLPVINDVRIFPKLYGKEQCSPGRKMGHVNIVDESGDHNLRSIAEKIFKEYEI